MGRTAMLFGLGELGGWVLEFLARCEGVSTIIAADVREEYGAMKTHCAALGAAHQGISKTIRFQKCDVTDIDATVELLQKFDPDVVYTCMALLAFGKTLSLPPEKFRQWESMGGGGRSPFHLLLASKLMKAVKESGIKAHVVQSAFPDLVNPVLWRNGIGALVGAGNLNLLVGEVKHKVSLLKNVPVREVSVCMIAAHALQIEGTRRSGVPFYGVDDPSIVKNEKTGIPYYCKISVRGEDITNQVDIDSLISDRLIRYNAQTRTSLGMPHQAAGMVSTIMAIMNDTNEFTHVPGPMGLPGSYPVRLNAKGVELCLPEEVTLEEALKINLEGLKHDGVEEIKDDGTVVLTEKVHKTQKELLGIDYKEIRLPDIDDIAKDFMAAYEKLVS